MQQNNAKVNGTLLRDAVFMILTRIVCSLTFRPRPIPSSCLRQPARFRYPTPALDLFDPHSSRRMLPYLPLSYIISGAYNRATPVRMEQRKRVALVIRTTTPQPSSLCLCGHLVSLTSRRLLQLGTSAQAEDPGERKKCAPRPAIQPFPSRRVTEAIRPRQQIGTSGHDQRLQDVVAAFTTTIDGPLQLARGASVRHHHTTCKRASGGGGVVRTAAGFPTLRQSAVPNAAPTPQPADAFPRC